MSSLSVSPSELEILRVAERAPATLAELASALRLSPGEIRLDVSDLKEKGLAELEGDAFLRVTPKGRDTYRLILKHPEVVEVPDARLDAEIDLDIAIEQALRKLNLAAPGNASEIVSPHGRSQAG
jgi:DNA-binding MarR family transcriptional regulator